MLSNFVEMTLALSDAAYREIMVVATHEYRMRFLGYHDVVVTNLVENPDHPDTSKIWRTRPRS